MTDIAVISPAQRIARVLAAEGLSANAEGPDWAGGVSGEVDAAWRSEIPRAIAVLRTLREPTAEMVDAGRGAGSDPAEIWSAMVQAALAEYVDEKTT